MNRNGSGSSYQHGSPFHVAPWEWTLTCGVIKIVIAAASGALPLLVPHLLPPVVGWMLFAGGLSELTLAWRGRSSSVGRLTFGSGAVTLITGALFIMGRWNGLFPLAQFVTIWLLLRGIVSLDVGVESRGTPAANWLWLIVRGAVDLGLGLMLLIGAPVAMLTAAVFGETQELISTFCWLLAASFLIGGASLVGIALAQRSHHRSDPFLSDGATSDRGD